MAQLRSISEPLTVNEYIHLDGGVVEDNEAEDVEIF